LRNQGRDYGIVVGRDLKYLGTVSVDTLDQARREGKEQLHHAYLPDVDPLPSDTQLSDILSVVAQAPCGMPVVNAEGTYKGVITRAILLEALAQTEENANVQ
jgi:glycine betaine/proline transport system ATP-binding protein